MLTLLLFSTLLNFSCISSNNKLGQETKTDATIIVDSTKNTACNICLIEDLRLKALEGLLKKKSYGENHESEQAYFDSLVLKKKQILEIFKTELGQKNEILELEKHANEQCLNSYSFPNLKESETTELLLKFDAYYWSLEIPTPYYSKFDINHYDKDKSGKYIYICKGNKTLMTEKQLEVQFNKVISSYDNLIHYKDSIANQYYKNYTGKIFSEIDRTEQLMFLEHKWKVLFGLYEMNLEQFVKQKETIRNDDIKLQVLKKKYLRVIELKE
jgi:hypothetical protein